VILSDGRLHSSIYTLYNSSNQLVSAIDSQNRTVSIDYADPSCSGCTTISYPGTAGATRVIHVYSSPLASVLRPGFSIQPYRALFSQDTSDTGTFNPTVVSSIQYPDGSQCSFLYDSYAELSRVTLPTGGAIEYDYGDGNNGSSDGFQLSSDQTISFVYRRLQERREYSNGTTLSSRTHYTASYPGSTQTVDTEVTYTGATPLSQVVHTMNGTPLDTSAAAAFGCDAQYEGLETRTDYGLGPDLTTMRTYATQYQQEDSCFDNPQVQSQTTIYPQTNLQSAATFSYDEFNNIVDKKEDAFGSGAPGPLARETQIAYLWASDGAYGESNYPSTPISRCFPPHKQS